MNVVQQVLSPKFIFLLVKAQKNFKSFIHLSNKIIYTLTQFLFLNIIYTSWGCIPLKPWRYWCNILLLKIQITYSPQWSSLLNLIVQLLLGSNLPSRSKFSLWSFFFSSPSIEYSSVKIFFHYQLWVHLELDQKLDGALETNLVLPRMGGKGKTRRGDKIERQVKKGVKAGSKGALRGGLGHKISLPCHR